MGNGKVMLPYLDKLILPDLGFIYNSLNFLKLVFSVFHYLKQLCAII